MGELTERGEIVASGGARLADPTGDDTLNRPEGTAESADAEQTPQGEADQGAEAGSSSAPGPADIPPPVVEKADDQDAATRENR
jgi:hypothetical protein